MERLSDLMPSWHRFASMKTNFHNKNKLRTFSYAGGYTLQAASSSNDMLNWKMRTLDPVYIYLRLIFSQHAWLYVSGNCAQKRRL